MKSERRHELQHNSLEDYVVKLGQRVQPYAKAITGGILAVVVLIGTYFYLNHRADAERANAWDRTFQAIYSGDSKDLRSVVDAYPGTPAALWAQLELADRELATGVAALFTEKSVGKNDIRTALDDYEAVQVAATYSLKKQHSLYVICRALGNQLGQLDKAKEAYKRLIRPSYAEGPYYARAKQELENLDRDSTKNFYDWFANVEPAPRSTTSPFGGTSPFESLPLPADLKMPSKGGSKTPPPTPKPDEGPAKAPASSTTAPKSTDTKPGDKKPGDSKPSDTKPAGGKSTDTKPPDPKPSDTKPADAKSTEPPKPADTKPADTKPADGKPADDKSK